MNHHFRHHVVGLASLFSVALFFNPATGANLINDDDGEYLVMISGNGEEAELLINGKSQLEDICATCTITLDNGNSLKIEDSMDVVTIRDGELETK